jgi:hypothetical protein
MNTANPTKSSNEVKITSTPTSSGFDDKMWADLLK